MQLEEPLKLKLHNLPEQPGIYRFLNKKGTIIYIGKAKVLKRRVNSYFISIQKHTRRIREMVRNVVDVEYTVTHTEAEALMLEANLIKHHQPKYNILLKDGKSYPYICLTDERFPRIISVYQKNEEGQYFGPYMNGGVMYALLNLIKSFTKLRTCTYNLSEENIQNKKFRLCLEYQIGNCGGACTGLQSEDSYMTDIARIKHILKGNFAPVISDLEGQMMKAAEQYAFEKAEWLRKLIEQLHIYKKKNTITSNSIEDVEVMTVKAEDSLAIINHFKVHNGTIIQTHSFEMKRQNEETEAEILLAAFEHLQNICEELYPEFLVNVEMEKESLPKEFHFNIPQRGDKKHLLDLSLKNCDTLIQEKLYTQTFKQKRTPQDVMMDELQKVLHLKEKPDHIECFDNSNFQGSFPVSSIIVFKNGKPSKKDYRHFNVKTVEGPDDFATMEEAVGRRYKRQLEENQPLPKLIIIDGGKGQLSHAAAALKKLDLLGKIPMIGIAKRLEEIYSLNDSLPLHIDKKSPALILIQRCRDEAHRFGITFHRDQRSRGVDKRTHLSEIDGIGEATAEKLLKAFKSVKKLKLASEEEIAEVVGKHKAGIVVKALAEQEKSS